MLCIFSNLELDSISRYIMVIPNDINGRAWVHGQI